MLLGSFNDSTTKKYDNAYLWYQIIYHVTISGD